MDQFISMCGYVLLLHIKLEEEGEPPVVRTDRSIFITTVDGNDTAIPGISIKARLQAMTNWGAPAASNVAENEGVTDAGGFLEFALVSVTSPEVDLILDTFRIIETPNFRSSIVLKTR